MSTKKTVEILHEILLRQAEINADLETIRAHDPEFEKSLALIIAQHELATRDTLRLLNRYDSLGGDVVLTEDF